MFDTAGRNASSTFFNDDRYWDLICVKAEKLISHRYVVVNGISTFSAISPIVGNSFLAKIQNSVKCFFGNCIFKFESLESSANSSWALSGKWSISLKPIPNGFWTQATFLKSIFDIKYVRNCVSSAFKWSTIIFAIKVKNHLTVFNFFKWIQHIIKRFHFKFEKFQNNTYKIKSSVS